jgi:hypothetical protein
MEAKRVLRAAKKKVKRAKGDTMERKNAKLAAETIEDGVGLVESRRSTLQKQVSTRKHHR